MSSSLYDTFGNETRYEISGDTLIAYINDATINFPLPEASSEILGTLRNEKYRIKNIQHLDMVRAKLEKSGFKTANANALAPVLVQVAEAQNIDPLEFFELNTNSLDLALDAYNAINSLRPAGSRIGLFTSNVNEKSPATNLIKH
jgi:hypothetical protein